MKFELVNGTGKCIECGKMTSYQLWIGKMQFYLCNNCIQDIHSKSYCFLYQNNEAKENYSKWHNVKENPDDLPKRDKNFCTNVSVAVFTKPVGVALYYFDDKKWYCQGKEVEVIEWCEIPQ